MNWDAIGAVGEIVGAFAVVVSLVYLAIQIRTQNTEARLASMHDTVAAQRDSLRAFLEPNVSEDFLAVIQDFDNADAAQRLRFTMVVMIALKANQDAYLQFLEYKLREDFFHPFGAQLVDMMANESAQKVWKLRKHQFDSRFQEYVDTLKVGKKIYL
jgi:hypothetical protein